MTEARTGANTFRDVEGTLVDNDNPEQMLMAEANDWGSDDIEEINAQMSGPVDVSPFFTKAGILSSAIVCSVRDDENKAVTNATLKLAAQPNLVPETDGVSGVYLFPAVSDGIHSVTITASSFPEATKILEVKGGELGALVFRLRAEDAEKSIWTSK